MPIEVVVRAGSDDAFIAWTSPFLSNCRGFALRRRIKHAAGHQPSPNTETASGADGFSIELVASWVGFAAGPDFPPGTRNPTTVWPIQKYLWSDFAARAGDTVAYQVTPMVGKWEDLREAADHASAWSETVTIGGEAQGKVAVYFNRGIVASQWLSRLLPSDPDPKKDATAKGKALLTIINTVGDRTRNFLSGDLRQRLIAELTHANAAKGHIYAALFELNDPELIALLKSFRKRAHILLGNGSVEKKGEDENETARAEIVDVCDGHDRFSAPRALAHNKFLVIADAAKRPKRVWTGSTNWTESGLCTQANNGLLIDNPAVAAEYLKQWQALVKAGNDSPEALKEADAVPRSPARSKGLTLWFAPLHGGHDLEQAGRLIAGAKSGILFLMFNPGPRGTLLNDIIEIASPASPHYKPDLYIQGVLNQNPGTVKNPVVLFNRGERIEANADVVLPAAIDARSKFWVRELLKLPRAHAMVHSKVVVIDPFGDHPVVMTGSHNMGPTASGTNDENLVIVEGNTELASRYATKIMEIYSQYRWRSSQAPAPGQKAWDGLADDDKWQIGAPDADARTKVYDRRRTRELDFWFGRG